MFVAQDTYAPGGVTRLHVHPDREKVFLALEGKARLTVGDESRELDPAASGSCRWAWSTASRTRAMLTCASRRSSRGWRRRPLCAGRVSRVAADEFSSHRQSDGQEA